jgi:hypothetical protein
MGLFKAFKKPTKPTKKPVDDSITPFQRTFLDQFPTWSIQHSQKLAQELTGVKLNEEEKAILIDCLIGGHHHYLIESLSQEKEDYELFGGNDKIIPAIVKTWPERASSFALEVL